MKKKILRPFLVLLFLPFSTLYAQTITTIAGDGTYSFGGDGGSATLAKLKQQWGIAVDECGNIYIGDAFNNRIRKVDALSGNISTIAGGNTAGFSGDGGPASSAKLRVPFDVVVDKMGNIYFTDNNNNRIRKIDLSGTISTIGGNGSSGFSGDGGPATAARLSSPDGIGIDDSGNILLPDGSNNRIRKINTAGIITTIAGNGSPTSTGDGGPATSGSINYASDVTADKQGNIYFTEFGGQRIRKIDTAGIITTIAGTGSAGYSGDGGPATAAQIHDPTGIDVDPYGNIYFGESYNNTVRKIDASGIITTYAGMGPWSGGYSGDGGPATSSELYAPHGIAHDNIGGIYISDRVNNVIRKIPGHNAMPIVDSRFGHGTTCAGTMYTFDSLTITDSNKGQHIYISLLSGPRHGSVTGLPADIISNGGANIIDSVSYLATAYTGNDTFSIVTGDCLGYDTFQIYVSILQTPIAGGFSGADSVCVGDTISPVPVVPGGRWTVTTHHASVDSISGRLIGTSAGYDTVKYIVSNLCGSDTVYKQLKVKNCGLGLSKINASNDLTIIPNPNNGHFYLDCSQLTAKYLHAKVFNCVGQVTAEIPLQSGSRNEIELPGASAGIYYLIVNIDGSQFYRRLVVY